MLKWIWSKTETKQFVSDVNKCWNEAAETTLPLSRSCFTENLFYINLYFTVTKYSSSGRLKQNTIFVSFISFSFQHVRRALVDQLIELFSWKTPLKSPANFHHQYLLTVISKILMLRSHHQSLVTVSIILSESDLPHTHTVQFFD
jgi:hypothetical protein